MTDTRKYYRVNEWCLLNAISRRSFYREVAAGRIVVRKYGTRTLVPAGQSLPTTLPTIRRAIGMRAEAQRGTDETAARGTRIEKGSNGHGKPSNA